MLAPMRPSPTIPSCIGVSVAIVGLLRSSGLPSRRLGPVRDLVGSLAGLASDRGPRAGTVLSAVSLNSPSSSTSPAIRLLLADVDGTLVTQEKILTEAAIAAVGELHEAGVLFALT